MRIKAGTKLMFIGDSVTDCGRARPIGAGSSSALGSGYVAVAAALLAASPEMPAIQVINMGVGGNTVRDLAGRWQRDVLALKPGWLSVNIGINDVWRQFDGRDDAGIVLPDEFRRTYDKLISLTLPRLAGLVLMSPCYVQSLRTDAMRARVDEYVAIVRDLAAVHSVTFVDVQAAIDAALTGTDYASLADDRVHPTVAGHQILARAFLDGVA